MAVEISGATLCRSDDVITHFSLDYPRTVQFITSGFWKAIETVGLAPAFIIGVRVVFQDGRRRARSRKYAARSS
jgi:hypothetical protein